ncbi:MAG TPA: OmpA family protein, partial [Gammaproteobacteria bacterium]|nr:OmpA family protein [Gammaproteobacteria bacterium]
TAQFRSNWELSAARALSVVHFLIDQGIAPRRLAAAGYGEYHPVTPGRTPKERRQNRRIELKITQR